MWQRPAQLSRTLRLRGFTLVELLVVIAIIAVLISIIAVSLRGVRATTEATISIANLRSLGQTIRLSTGQNADKYPFPPWDADRQMAGPLFWEPPGNLNPPQYFFSPIWAHARTFWPALLHDVAPWAQHYETWLAPGLDVPEGPGPIWERARHVSYSYSNAFLGAPRIWTPGASATLADIGPVAESAVAFPSAKVIFNDYVRPYLRAPSPSDPRPLLFCDGSAALRRDADAIAPGVNTLTNGSQRYHDTTSGAAGRDF